MRKPTTWTAKFVWIGALPAALVACSSDDGDHEPAEASSSPLQAVASFEAESLPAPAYTAVVGVENEAAASAGKALAIYSNGAATSTISLGGSASSIIVRARSMACNGGAHLLVDVDGQRVITTTAASTYTDYTANTPMAAGKHTIRLSFDNDSGSGTCDRNLLVDKITFASAGQAPTVSTSAASGVSGAAATLNGSVNPNGATTTGWFRYATSNPGSCNDTFGTRAPDAGGVSLGSGTASVALSQGISGLTAGTTYYFCAIASNASGKSFGPVASLTTPSATGSPPGGPTANAACLQGPAYYVATTGSDSAVGSKSAPWRTVAHAASVAAPGNTVCVRGGTYTDQVSLSRSGTATNPITITAYPGESPVIDFGGRNPPSTAAIVSISGNYNVFDGFEVRNGSAAVVQGDTAYGISVTGQHNVVSNNTVHHVGQAGILVYGTASYNTVRANTVHDAAMQNYGGAGRDWASGIQIYGPRDGSHFATGNVLDHNVSHDNWGEGIYGFYGVTDTVISGNVAYNNWNMCIGLANSYGGAIYGNLAYYANPSAKLTYSIAIFVGSDGDDADPGSNNNSVYNNFAYGAPIALNTIGGTKPLSNTLVAFNSVFGVVFDAQALVMDGTQSGLVIENNIFDGQGFNVHSSAISKADHNYWRTAPNGASAGLHSAATDIIGAASTYWAKTPGSVGPGLLTPHWFDLLAASPARGKGVSIAAVTTDAFGTARPNPPAIGAHQY